MTPDRVQYTDIRSAYPAALTRRTMALSMGVALMQWVTGGGAGDQSMRCTAALSSWRKSGCAMSASAAARWRIDLPRRWATPYSVTT